MRVAVAAPRTMTNLKEAQCYRLFDMLDLDKSGDLSFILLVSGAACRYVNPMHILHSQLYTWQGKWSLTSSMFSCASSSPSRCTTTTPLATCREARTIGLLALKHFPPTCILNNRFDSRTLLWRVQDHREKEFLFKHSQVSHVQSDLLLPIVAVPRDRP